MDKETLEFPIILAHEKAKADPLSPAVKEKINQLYSEGKNYAEIARELSISISRISYHCRQNRVPLAARILKKHIVSIVQECEIKSAVVGGNSKTIQINAPIQLVGDRAIEVALSEEPICFDNPNKAIDYLLDHLPEPKLEHLKALAVAAAIRRQGQLNPAAAELGISSRAIRYLKDKAVNLGMSVDQYLGPLYWKYMSEKKRKRLMAGQDGQIGGGDH